MTSVEGLRALTTVARLARTWERRSPTAGAVYALVDARSSSPSRSARVRRHSRGVDRRARRATARQQTGQGQGLTMPQGLRPSKPYVANEAVRSPTTANYRAAMRRTRARSGNPCPTLRRHGATSSRPTTYADEGVTKYFEGHNWSRRARRSTRTTASGRRPSRAAETIRSRSSRTSARPTSGQVRPEDQRHSGRRFRGRTTRGRQARSRSSRHARRERVRAPTATPNSRTSPSGSVCRTRTSDRGPADGPSRG